MNARSIIRPLGRLPDVARFAFAVATFRARSVPSIPVDSDTWRASAYLYGITLAADLASYEVPWIAAVVVAIAVGLLGTVWAKRSSRSGRCVFLIFATSSLIHCADILTHNPWVSLFGVAVLGYAGWQLFSVPDEA